MPQRNLHYQRHKYVELCPICQHEKRQLHPVRVGSTKNQHVEGKNLTSAHFKFGKTLNRIPTTWCSERYAE